MGSTASTPDPCAAPRVPLRRTRRARWRRLRPPATPVRIRRLVGLALGAGLWLAGPPLRAQSDTGTPARGRDSVQFAPTRVDVTPVAQDEQIRRRLQRVLQATGWFDALTVRVEEGVVFLDGRAPSPELKQWAGDLARRTQDVIAVVNRLVLPTSSPWDIGPAKRGLLQLWRDLLRLLPLIGFGTIILALSFAVGIVATRGMRSFLVTRVPTALLRGVLARAAGVLVFLFGVYIILRVLGLTQLALTVVGGTGLVGLAVGLAFREISENFLASIFLSVQQPFRTGDLIEADGVTGYVQQLNTRTTVLITLDGNIAQIPNATVYKSTLRNYTSNVNRREHFDIGIGYGEVISEAQEIALRVLLEHPAVLDHPEPMVLVDSLGASAVTLRVYFWLNGREHSWLKVRSSVIRLIKREFQQRGISIPDEAREVLFPRGVPVTIVNRESGKAAVAAPAASPLPAPARGDGAVDQAEGDGASTAAEAGLASDAETLEAQGRRAAPAGENLLSSSAD